jgi:ribonuclease J
MCCNHGMVRVLSSLRVIPLGGCGEFGRNLTIYESDGDLVVVDCGAQIAEAEAGGVERFVPDLGWLAERKGRLRAYVVTHAHEDHLGALSYALSICPAPVHALPLGLELGRRQLEQAGMADQIGLLQPLVPRAPIRFGALTVEALLAAHSIPDACALAIASGTIRAVHTGDLKLDHAADNPTDLERLTAFGAAGLNLLVADSTNAARAGRSRSEAAVRADLQAEIGRCTGRLAVTMFSTNLVRLGAVLAACEQVGRKVCLVGRGLRETAAAATAIGMLQVPGDLLVDEERAARLPRSEIALILTGSQGEPRSALGRIALGTHPILRLERGDRLLMSSRPVPGNEARVERLVDHLIDAGVELVDSPGIHASGHACREELLELYSLVRPRAVLPIHGRPRQLEAQARLAESAGILVVRGRDGDVVEVGESGAGIIGKVPTGRLSVEGLRVGDVGSETLKERARLFRAGVVTVARIQGRIEVEAHGVCEGPEREWLISAAEAEAERALRDSADGAQAVRRAVAKVFEAARGVRPFVLALL